MTATDSPAFAAWLDRFTRDLSTEDRVAAFVRRVDEEITARIPEIAADPVLVDDLHASTRHQWLAFLSMLTQPHHRLVLPQQADDLARSLARRGADLGVLLKVYRAAHHGVFGFMTSVVDALGADAPPRDEVLKLLWHRADLWLDDSIEALIGTFYDERQEQHEGAMARRAELIESLLAGVDVPVDEATPRLGHPLGQWQSAFVLWADVVDASTTDAMISVAGELARALGGPRPLVRVAGSRDVWCWVATPERPDPTALAEAGRALAEGAVRVAAGLPAAGLAGFRSSHLEARAAQHLAMSAVGLPPLVRYADVELLCLTAERPDLLQRMVTREVGALCGADRNLAALRETVLTHLTHRMNVEATAAALFVHKNTVRYRLARAEELLGHPLAERAALVELALRHVEAFGQPPPGR